MCVAATVPPGRKFFESKLFIVEIYSSGITDLPGITLETKPTQPNKYKKKKKKSFFYTITKTSIITEKLLLIS